MKINLQPISIETYENLAKTSVIQSYNTSVAWLSIYEKQVEIVGIFDVGKNYIGCFFIYLGKKMSQTFAITPPYSQNIGLQLYHNATNQAAINSLYKSLHEEIANYLLAKKTLMFNIVFPADFFDAQPYLWKNCEASLKYSYVLDLANDTDALMANYAAERRKNINKALKDGLVSELSHNFELLYEMTHKTLALKKADANTTILRSLFFDYATKDNAFGFITYKDGKPSAMVFLVYDAHTAYYLFGYFDKANAHEGAGALAMHSAIAHSKSLQLTTFDFCGSMLPSVEKYFRGFGPKLLPLMQIVHSSNKGKLLLRLRNRKLTK